MEPIVVSVHVDAPLEKVWEHFTEPEHIMQWNQASDDWHCPKAENDLRVGGAFVSRMEAKDGSDGFDFTGVYTDIIPLDRIAYVMEDGRAVVTVFLEEEGGTTVTTAFDPETENPRELQEAGWRAILESFKRHVEGV